MTSMGNALPGWFRRGKSNKDSHASRDEPASPAEGTPVTEPGAEADASSNTNSPSSVEPGGVSVPVTGGEGETEPVVVWEAANRMEAEIVRSRLESEGIPAVITGDVAGSIFGLNVGNLAKSSVLVPAPLADRALRILESAVDDDMDMDDSEAGEVISDEPDDKR